MNQSPPMRCTAFEGTRRIASGELPQVALKVKAVMDRGERAPVLIFDDVTGQFIDVDLRGALEDVLARVGQTAGNGAPAGGSGPSERKLQPTHAERGAGLAGSDEPPANVEKEAQRRPGRPKLGVVGREVTLLPRHWDWLNHQPGGASVALRKLVEDARRVNQTRDRVRLAQEAAYRFMSAIAGNEAGFEEAIRALFAGKRDRFDAMVESWPVDVRDHARKLAAGAFCD
jgi:uncharacterized protein